MLWKVNIYQEDGTFEEYWVIAADAVEARNSAMIDHPGAKYYAAKNEG